VNPVQRVVQTGLLKAYGAVSRTGVLDHRVVQRLYGRLYFVYKRRIEAGSLSALLETVAPGSVVIDVGANIGFFTVHFARRVGPTGLVLAFEPGRENVELLRWNVARAQARNVRIVDAALGDHDGDGTLFLNPVHPADHRIFRGRDGRPSRPIRVATLDSFLADSELGARVSLVKIDVQGAEMQVLRGMSRTLKEATAAQLLVEFTPEALVEAGESPGAFLELFRASGYRPRVFDDGRRTFVDATDAEVTTAAREHGYVDVLYVRSDAGRR
jgi:FkbM family methyltransferase